MGLERADLSLNPTQASSFTATTHGQALRVLANFCFLWNIVRLLSTRRRGTVCKHLNGIKSTWLPRGCGEPGKAPWVCEAPAGRSRARTLTCLDPQPPWARWCQSRPDILLHELFFQVSPSLQGGQALWRGAPGILARAQACECLSKQK